MNSFTKADMVEMKSMAKPPSNVKKSAAATMVLLDFATPHDVRNPEDQRLWESFKRVLARQNGDDALIVRMKSYDPKKVSPEQLSTAKQLLEGLSVDSVMKVSMACASLYRWVAEAIEVAEGCQVQA